MRLAVQDQKATSVAGAVKGCLQNTTIANQVELDTAHLDICRYAG